MNNSSDHNAARSALAQYFFHLWILTRNLSFNRIVVDAIIAYERDQLHLSVQDEERLAARTADAVADKLQQMLPAYLAGYAAGASVPTVVSTVRPVPIEPPLKAETSSDDDMPDFSGSVMDFGFMGS